MLKAGHREGSAEESTGNEATRINIAMTSNWNVGSFPVLLIAPRASWVCIVMLMFQANFTLKTKRRGQRVWWGKGTWLGREAVGPLAAQETRFQSWNSDMLSCNQNATSRVLQWRLLGCAELARYWSNVKLIEYLPKEYSGAVIYTTQRCLSQLWWNVKWKEVKVKVLAAQSCPALRDPVDCSPPGSSVHGILQAKNTGVGCHSLVQEVFPTQGSNPDLLHCKPIPYCLSHKWKESDNWSDIYIEKHPWKSKQAAVVGSHVSHQWYSTWFGLFFCNRVWT